jgi:MFS family permease
MPTLASGVKASIDWAGSVTLVLSVVPLLLALTLDKAFHPWDSALIIGLIVIAVIFGAVFLYIETQAESPIIKLSLFKDKIFSVTIVSSFLNGAAFFGAFLFLSLFLVNVAGVSATESGSSQIPLMLSFVVGSIVATQLVSKTGRYKPFILFGFAMMLIGFYSMTQLDVTSSTEDVVWRMLLLGIGLGPTIPLLNLAMQNAIPFAYMGTAVANRQFFQQLGQAVGAAVFGVILTTTLTTQITIQTAPIVNALPTEYRKQVYAFDLKEAAAGSSDGMSLQDTLLASVNTDFDNIATQLNAAVLQKDPTAVTALVANPALPAELKERIQSEQIDPATLPTILAGIEAGRAPAIANAVGLSNDIGQAIKQAFTNSITQIYRDAIWLVVISFLLVLFGLPEVPLRKTNRDAPVISE